jgi:hypothetical protein
MQVLSRERLDPMAKRTTITIETWSLLVLRSQSSTAGWCPVCAARVEMLLFEDAGLLTEHAPVLAEWLKSGEVHCMDSIDGSVLVCLDSLLARAQNGSPPNAVCRDPNT